MRYSSAPIAFALLITVSLLGFACGADEKNDSSAADAGSGPQTQGGRASGGKASVEPRGGSAGSGENSGGATSSGGTAGAGSGGVAHGGEASLGDTPAPRNLNVTASKQRHEHRFKPSLADPEVNLETTFSNGDQVALVDPRSTKMLGKLVVTLGGVGSEAGFVGSVGSFCVERGFHVFAVTYYSSYNIVRGDADFYGDARLEAFEGVDHTNAYEFATVHITPPDSIERRVAKGLAYMQARSPEQDFGYFLNADGGVRWSDVIIVGFSHGASSAARIAMVRRLSRAVSLSGPRDNSCGSDPDCKGGTAASWFSETPKTPIERFFAMTGVKDGQHREHLFAMNKLGYLGTPIDVDTSAPPYADSHRLFTSSDGHSEFCGKPQYDAACNYMFGVPPENHNGIQ